jgi:hypothetical protein
MVSCDGGGAWGGAAVAALLLLAAAAAAAAALIHYRTGTQSTRVSTMVRGDKQPLGRGGGVLQIHPRFTADGPNLKGVWVVWVAFSSADHVSECRAGCSVALPCETALPD